MKNTRTLLLGAALSLASLSLSAQSTDVTALRKQTLELIAPIPDRVPGAEKDTKAQIALGNSSEAVVALDGARADLDPADLGLALALAGDTGTGVEVLSEALRLQRLPDADAALRAGYYDQSHLARDTRLLTGATLRELLRQAHADGAWWPLGTPRLLDRRHG